MVIRFRDRRLANTCNGEQSFVAQFGRDNAKKIMMRLIELCSVDNLSQISSIGGHVDISRITEITILEVTDYHGE